MDTGYQSFLKLGLNAPYPAYFRRTLSCAPLTDRLWRAKKRADNSTYVIEYTHGYPSQSHNLSKEPILWSHGWPNEDVNKTKVGYETRQSQGVCGRN